MQFTDTHSHLYDEAYAGEEDLAVERSVSSGVDRIITPDIDSQTRESMFRLADRHPGVLFPALGLHPTSVNADWKSELDKLSDYQGREIWAIGEVGIDCYWSKEFLEQQRVFLAHFISHLSPKFPTNIHLCRQKSNFTQHNSNPKLGVTCRPYFRKSIPVVVFGSHSAFTVEPHLHSMIYFISLSLSSTSPIFYFLKSNKYHSLL